MANSLTDRLDSRCSASNPTIEPDVGVWENISGTIVPFGLVFFPHFSVPNLKSASDAKMATSNKIKPEVLLTKEYDRFADRFAQNELVGEKRLNFFITLATAFIAGLVTLATSNKLSLSSLWLISATALSSLILFGNFTYFRMLQRKKVNTECKVGLDYTVHQLRSRSEGLENYAFKYFTKNRFTGGYTDTVALINSLLLGLLAGLVALLISEFLVFPISAGLLFGAVCYDYYRHNALDFSKDLKKLEQEMRKEMSLISPTFRAGVGAIVLNSSNQILVLERKDVPGAWQLPQGGVCSGENFLEAAYRELEEETGISKTNLECITDLPELTVYELPEEYQSPKTGLGQVHRWYLFRLTTSEDAVSLGEGKEFRAWKWIELDSLENTAADFRKAVYRHLIRMIESPELRALIN